MCHDHHAHDTQPRQGANFITLLHNTDCSTRGAHVGQRSAAQLKHENSEESIQTRELRTKKKCSRAGIADPTAPWQLPQRSPPPRARQGAPKSPAEPVGGRQETTQPSLPGAAMCGFLIVATSLYCTSNEPSGASSTSIPAGLRHATITFTSTVLNVDVKPNGQARLRARVCHHERHAV